MRLKQTMCKANAAWNQLLTDKMRCARYLNSFRWRLFLHQASLDVQYHQKRFLVIGTHILKSSSASNQPTSFPSAPVSGDTPECRIPLNLYEKASSEVLEHLAEAFDVLLEDCYPRDFDISMANGVLTIQLKDHGTYVINKQTPNRQIWLSSPSSGPKRYDLTDDHNWIYHHDGRSIYQLLNEEFSQILSKNVDLTTIAPL